MIAAAMMDGIKRWGHPVSLHRSDSFHHPIAKVAVFYGFDAHLQRVFREYRAAGLTVVFVDLGYFGRIEGGKFAGYHKVSVNSRHPTAYFQQKQHDNRRAARFGIKVGEWHSGSSILLAGASGKGASSDGFRPEEWETRIAWLLRSHTNRQIIYRPKPSYAEARPIPGTVFAQTKADISLVLRDCHAVVTHHSNAALDGLIHGVPAFCVEGVALPLALSDFSKVETPRTEGDRQQLINDVAYCQFSIQEMRDGVCWRHLLEEGLIG